MSAHPSTSPIPTSLDPQIQHDTFFGEFCLGFVKGRQSQKKA
ncbi:MAG: hypothetical protein VB949_08715 [Pseudomonadales bacterium]